MTSFLSQLNGKNVLPGQIIVLTMPVGFVGPAKNILIHMTNIGKQFPEPTISILEYFFQSTNIAKNTFAVTHKSNIKTLLAKGDIVRQISKGAESKKAKEITNNQNLIKKFIKTIYFLDKKKWTVKNNFEETIEHLANLGVDDIFQHINNAPKNSTYISTFSAEQFLKAVGDFLSNQIITDLIAAGDFTILADESTDEADHSQMSIFVCFVDAFGNKPVEIFLGIVKLTTSKKAVDLHEIIIKHLESKNLDSFCICFSGLDGTNAMNGEQKGLQCLIRHTALHSLHFNTLIAEITDLHCA